MSQPSPSTQAPIADHALLSPAGLPADAATEARAIPGVRSVTSLRHTSVIIGGLALPAQAIDNAGAIDPGVTSGSLDDLGDDVDRALLKSDGSYAYFASDIAYHREKWRRGATDLIDVLGADHGG